MSRPPSGTPQGERPGSGAASARPHIGARLEDRVFAVVGTLLRRRGWRPAIVPYSGYGSAGAVGTGGAGDPADSAGFARILARVVLTPPGAAGADPSAREAGDPRTAGRQRAARGWRRFLAVAVPDAEVTVRLGGREHRLVTARGGYLDRTVPAALGPGWHEVPLRLTDGPDAVTRVLVVAPGPQIGLVSDIDDTVLVTLLPRPLVAAWNTFVLRETARRPVPGMAGFYADVLARHPRAPVVYLSTGAWNVAATLTRFLSRNGFPEGPLLLTDWGPTNTGWFRSGQEHKRSALRRLAQELPGVRWLLVGDDGQHDPALYAEFAAACPDQVAAVAIRLLTPAQQVLAGNTQAADKRVRPGSAPTVTAADGAGLSLALAEGELLGPQGAR
ncbi:DUF2183 domain-containing protein [Nakamurella flavida]|uniref:DUF2183 domain-containing protein n=1 Tax=Nakamurella flavida TaxID=363630 RepID=A0A938YN84_9ACTN|nr:phosphatase domain-containing protein [Nakamurella flavida]MBM9477656.1 DUF2183 domain-containing protein [Nakamurella flavida]MDP9779206.1 phosphatidate phosphatase APP1 [Nakamurella flavida]